MTVNRREASAARRAAPLALLLAACFALSTLVALRLPLVDPDEGRNAEVAREMAVSGDLVVPHLAGMPYLDKPPGFFWAAALSIRALGPTPLAARLPSVLASLATLALVGAAARRAGGDRLALIAVALLAAAPLYAALSAYVIFDMPLTLCVTVVWLGVAREVGEARGLAPIAGGARVRRRLAMFAAIAAGILLKGPVMLAWALGGSLGAALVLRSWTALRWLAWLPGWVIALGIPGAWFAFASQRFPEYPHYALLEESLERLTRGTFHREQPWWFVPAVLAGGTLPWSLTTPWRAALGRHSAALAPATAGAGLGEPSAPPVGTTSRAGLGFVAFAFVFFTLSHSKLVTYLLPALPPLAWMGATAWSRSLSRRRELLVRLAVSAAVTAALGVTLALLARSPERIEKAAPSGAPLARAIALAGGGPVRYEGCYSPGTDYLLGRGSTLSSERGEETTSNYIVRYRETLLARGLWRAVGRPAADSPEPRRAGIVVRSASDTTPAPGGGVHLFRDRRFVAYRVGAAADSAAASSR